MILEGIKHGAEPLPLFEGLDGGTAAPSPGTLDSFVVPPGCPAGKYRCIVADPPWDVKRGCEWASNGPTRDLEYPTMSIEEIAALRIPAHQDCVMFIWTINKYLRETYDIAEAWGFRPCQLLTWAKQPRGIGLGGNFTQTSEHILMARRGSVTPKRRWDTSWWAWRRARHSQKPEDFQNTLEKMYHGPYLEMFARRRRAGWDTWGNEV